MTINFEPPVAVYSAVRQNAHRLEDFDAFEGLRTSFMSTSGATTGGYAPEKISGESYTGYKLFKDENAAYGGEVKLTGKYAGPWDDLFGGLNVAMAERMFNDGATVTVEPEKYNWSFQGSGKMTATGDKFVMRVTNDKVVASNYKNQATLTGLDAWCETYVDTA